MRNTSRTRRNFAYDRWKLTRARARYFDSFGTDLSTLYFSKREMRLREYFMSCFRFKNARTSGLGIPVQTSFVSWTIPNRNKTVTNFCFHITAFPPHVSFVKNINHIKSAEHDSGIINLYLSHYKITDFEAARSFYEGDIREKVTPRLCSFFIVHFSL